MMGGTGGMMGGMNPLGGMGMDMGGMDMDMGGMDPGAAQIPQWATQLDDMCERISMGLVGARVRTRALVELLEEKGVLAGEEFDTRASAIWERDYETLSEELTAPLREQPPTEEAAAEDEEGEEAHVPSGPSIADYFSGQLANFVDDFVAARVRLRTTVELLEEKGIFAAGEYDAKVESIWDRDYEELILNFHQGNF